MKRFSQWSVAALAAAMLAGCQTAGGPAGSSDLRAAQGKAMSRQQTLEKQLASHLVAQSSISNRAEALHAQLLAAAQELRSIKEQANLVSTAATTNRVALEALRAEIGKQRTQIEELEKKAREESEKVKLLQDALSKEQKVRQQEAQELKAAGERQAADERKKADALRDALSKEQKLRDGEKAVAQQREKEIADLRKALEERDRTLRAQAAPAPAKAAQAAPAPQPSAVKQVAAGNAALRAGQFDEAEKQFKDALVAMPGMVGARIGLAACRYERGDLDGADGIVSAVLKEDRLNAQALGLAGLLHWRRGRLEEAEGVLAQAVKEEKQDSQLRNYLGIVLYERKKFGPAAAALRKAVEIDPGNGEAHYNLSVVLAMSPEPDLDEARTHYQRAQQLGSARDEAMEKILAPPAAKP